MSATGLALVGRTARRFRRFVAGTAFLAMASAGIAAQAQNWNLYGTNPSTGQPYVAGPTISFAAGPMGPDNGAVVSLTVGNATLPFIMDTGSNGILISKDLYDGRGGIPLGPGTETLTSSGVVYSGNLIQTTVAINSGPFQTKAATANVVVLQVTSISCLPGARECTPTQNPQGVSYMGVGFNRGISTVTPSPGNPQTGLNTNPFINIVSIGPDDTPATNLKQGYIITNSGVTLGLSTAATSNFAFVKLTPDTSPFPATQAGTIWMQAPATVTVGDKTGSGTILPDTGIDYAFLTPPSFVGIGPCATNPPGGNNCLPSDVGVLVTLPGQTSPIPATYSLTDSDSPLAPKSVVMNPPSSETFLNTGRLFYRGFDYLYDPTDGFVGYKSQSSFAGVTPAVALTGTVNLPDGFANDLPTVLFGPTTLLEAGTGTISGVISGANSLTIGGGRMTLTNVNTYSGGTIVTGGATLRVNADSGMGDVSGGLTLSGGTLHTLGSFGSARAVTLAAGGGTFDTSGGNLALSAPVSGPGGLTKVGPGVLTLSGANSYTGGTTVNAGTLLLAPGASLPSGGALAVNGGLLDLNGNDVTVGALAGSGGAIALGAGTLTTDSAATTTLASTISGSGGLTKQGSGILILSGTNSYTGGTTIAGGTLALSGGASIASSSLVTVNGTFDISSNGPVTNIMALAGSGTVLLGGSVLNITNASTEFSGVLADGGNNGALAIAGGTQTLSGVAAYALSTQIDAGATLALKGGGSIASSAGIIFAPFGPGSATLDISQTNAGATVSSLSDPDGVGIVNLGSKTLTITVGAPFAGVIQDGGIAGGTGGGLTLAAGAMQNLMGVNTYTGATTILSGGVLQLSGSIAASSGVILGGLGAAFETSGNQTLKDLSGLAGSSLLLGGNLTVGTANSTTFAGMITGTGDLVKQGSGTLTLSGASNFAGGITVAAGTLQLGADDVLPSTVPVVLAGGTFDLNGFNQTVGALSGSGAIALGSGTLIAGDANNTSLSAPISGSGGLVKQGSGTLILGGANTYTGGTIVVAGTLQIGGSLAPTGGLTVNGGIFDLNGNDVTVGALAGSGGAIALGAGTLTTDSAATTTLASTISGSGGLAKQGSGILILSGANSYTGGTTIAGGTLQGTTSSLQGNIVDNANLVFSQSTTGTYGGVISGSGRVGITGGGTVIFTGANTYGGGTVVSGATLQGTTLSLQGNIINNGAVVFSQAGAGTYAGVLSGTGSLAVQGGVALTLTGANSYRGGTTVAAGSSLLGTTASVQGNIVNNGAVTIGQASAGTFTGNVSGSGSLAVQGGGTITLVGTNSYTGGTTVGAGTILQGDPLSLQGDILDNGTVRFDHAFTGTYAGNISGSGGLTKAGSGTVILTGTNSYTGPTLVSGGILRGNTSSLRGDIIDNAAVQFHQTTDGTYAGMVSGTGSLIKSGAATLTLSGASIHTGSTIILEGALQIDSTRIQGNIVNDALLIFDQSAAGTYSGNISGQGGLTKIGAGSLTLSGANSYAGGTTVSAGSLIGTTTNLQGNVVNNAAVIFSQAFAGTYAGNMSGTGGLTIQGGGQVTLTGTNSFTGGLNIDGSTIVGNSASLQGNITNNGSIVFNQTTSGSYAGNMTGTGGVTLQGGGALALTGSNTYTGPTAVNAGLLSVNGSITSNVTVASGGTLGGSGTIFGAVTSSGATSPGNSIGTLTVAGPYTQTAGGSFQAEVNGAGQSDRLNVTGTATLLGGTVNVVVQQSSYAPRTTFVLLNAAGGRTGTYSAVVKDFTAPFLQPSLSYDANNVFLTLEIGGFQAAARTPTEAAVGAVLDAAAASATGDLATILGTLAPLGSAQVLPVLTAISGQNYSSLSSAMVQSGLLFMNNFSAVAGGGAGPASTRVALAEACETACEAAPTALWGAWGGALGGLGTIGSGSSTGAVTYNAGGFAAGLDRKLAPSFTAGLALGYVNGTQWTAGFNGRSASDTYQVGLYGLFNQGAFYLDGLAGYAYSANRMWRSLQIPGLAQRTATGQAGANQFFGQVEAGYRFDLPGAGASAATASYVTPFARLQGFTATQNGFAEQGAQSLNLDVAAQTTNALRSVLGAQLGSSLDLGWRGPLGVQARLGWSHEFADTARPVTATLAGAPTLPFTTYGASPQRDGLLIGFAANTDIAQSSSLFVRYEATLSGQDSTHALSAGLRVTW